MVIISCLRNLNYTNTLKIIGAHVEYANRQESVREAKFLEFWCKENDIIFEKESVTHIKRSDMDRSDYEEISRKLRFGLYNRIVETYGCAGIFLGHHAGDIAENVFTNVVHGRNLLDLEVIKEITTTQGINFWRPLVKCYKDAIFKFAQKYQIPYFKDSTPDWSNRGVLRRRLFPIFRERYGDSYQKNLVKIGQQSSDWSDLINTKIIEPFMQNHVKIGRLGAIITFTEFQNSPTSFWDVVLRKVLHSLQHNMISQGTLERLINILHSNKRNCKFMFTPNITSYITDSRLIILSKQPFVLADRHSITPSVSRNEDIPITFETDTLTIQLCNCTVVLKLIESHEHADDYNINLSDFDSDYIEGRISYAIPASTKLLLSNRISSVDSTTKNIFNNKLSKVLHPMLPVVSLQKGTSYALISGYLLVTISF
jgi:tRNA(Ile)-lysidine synthetase-like protein